jgi:hypothetical protein
VGKTSKRRPRAISAAEWYLNYDLAHGKISRRTFVRRLAKLRQKDLLRMF